MLFRLVVALVCVSVALAGANSAAAVPVKENFITSLGNTITDLTKDHSLSASVDGVESRGLEGLNLKFTAPYKFMDYVVGFKSKITDVKSLAPDSLFVRRSFDDVDVALDYDLDSKKFSGNTRWSNDKLSVQVDGDSEDYITQVAATVKHTFSKDERDINTKIRTVYDTLSMKVKGTFGLASGDAAAQLDLDADNKDAILGLSYKINEFTAHPVINLKNGDVKYGLSRSIGGGEVDTVFTPHENVQVEWSDKASSGTWKTKVNYPLDGGQTKVSFARDFDC